MLWFVHAFNEFRGRARMKNLPSSCEFFYSACLSMNLRIEFDSFCPHNPIPNWLGLFSAVVKPGVCRSYSCRESRKRLVHIRVRVFFTHSLRVNVDEVVIDFINHFVGLWVVNSFQKAKQCQLALSSCNRMESFVEHMLWAVQVMKSVFDFCDICCVGLK